ncbi:sodium:calcium antiporter [Tepidiforma bonchosmolovskayae]|uniref:Sodium:calcium antiporter n=1 Tax=Tepidiforma bonchosmolovskayae TaxID=2601677 RepID=A0ABX6C4E3_9CHLR|nr:sodium:calcium antiporter [Tepidiforma bonchosmolovskayae]QFG04130.1 sodium:calcium antiporter [Tepidiforma bonchosmolovskayae]
MGADRRAWLAIGAMATACAPGIALRFAGYHPPAVAGAAIFGLAILAAAFLLSWGAETAEMDISQGLALAIIAIIAVLPEYAVDFVLAWKAGADPAEAERGLAVANMTGGNRLLIGIGWPLVFFLFFYRTRIKELIVDRERSLELTFLAAATAYVIFIPLRSHVSVIDTIVLVSLFVMYMFFTSRVETEEVELVGPARAIGALQNAPRRAVVVVLLVYSAAAIFASAEPFAESLVHIGEQFGVSEFFLIQWLAPLASESPEVLVACLLAWRGRAAAGMGVLISSKVNQWTLLIGTLPVAFLVSAGDFGWTIGLPLDARQRDEIFLTAAQSAFAIAVFANLKMSRVEAAALFLLFATQLFITNEHARVLYGMAYAALCLVLLAWNWRDLPRTARDAFAIMRGRELPGAEHELPARDPDPVP